MKIIKAVFSVLLLLFAFLNIKQGLQPAASPEEIRKNYTALDATVSAIYLKKIHENVHDASLENSRREARDINHKYVPELSYSHYGKDVKKEFEYFGWNKLSPAKYSVGDKVQIWLNNTTDEVLETGELPGDSRTANIVIGVVMILIIYFLWFGLVPGVLRKKR